MDEILNGRLFARENGKFFTKLKILAHIIKPDKQIYFLDSSPLEFNNYVFVVIFKNEEINPDKYVCVFWRKDRV